MADVDETPTPIACDACGGDPERRVGCAVCGGSGVITAEKRRSRSRDRLRRVSTTHLAFAEEAGKIAERLEQLTREHAAVRASRAAVEAGELAEEGRALERTFRSWTSTPPEDDARAGTINALIDWNRRAHDLLAG